MRVLIGVPTRGLISLGTVNFLAKQKCQLFCATSSISVTASRRKIAHHFLNSAFDALLFLDDDVVPPDDVLQQLVNVNKPIVSASYPIHVNGVIKSCACTQHWSVSDNTWQYFTLDEVGIKEVAGCGLGCCLIKKEVFKKVGIDFSLIYKGGDLVTGEDLDFCNRVRKAGFKIYCNFNASCEHVKPIGLKTIYNRYCLSKGR